MISPQFFFDFLAQHQMNFYAGVPDSLLKNLCAYITDNTDNKNHTVSINEGAAIALGAGYYLATGKIPIIYMQNSGLGNCINPLASLTDKEVYKIPLLLLIGWRGEPGVKDEPQHVKQGRVTMPLLDTMEIKNEILSGDENEAKKQLEEAIHFITKTHEPFAFVIKKDTFEPYNLMHKITSSYTLSREEAIQLVAGKLCQDEVIVSTTGMTSRELFEYRENRNEGHEREFLTVGSMGHASQIALGIALQQPQRDVFCFDGDGAALMHLGSLAIVGAKRLDNYYHILFNNEAHDSVGGQPTVGNSTNIPAVAKACGYAFSATVSTKEELEKLVEDRKKLPKPLLIEIKVKKGNRKELGRPTTTPQENKEALMRFLKKK